MPMHSIIKHLYIRYTLFLFAQANQPSETLQYHPSLTWSPQAQTWRNFNWRLPCGFYSPWNSIPNELTLKQAETVILWWNSSIASNLPLCSWPLKAKEKVHASNKVFDQRKHHDDSQSIFSTRPEAKADVTKELKDSWLDTAANSLCGGLVASTPSKCDITNSAFWRSKQLSQISR